MTIAPSATDESKFLYTGKAAHICAASPGGPRYDSRMTAAERKAIQNAIFLCSSCAETIDKNGGADFTVGVLHEWKRCHEKWALENLNKRREQHAHPPVVINVTSIEQRGGITAGIVHVGSQPRRLDASHKQRLLEFIVDKSRTVTVISSMGDAEAYEFATEIKGYLGSEGLNVDGVHYAVFSTPFRGQQFDPSTYTLRIGSGR